MVKKLKLYWLVLILAPVFFIGLAVNAEDADQTAPSTIANLAVSSIAQSSVVLSWTAPGDDGAVGTSTSYDLRYFSSAITNDNWASSTQVTGEPTPKAAGNNETMTVAGLSTSTVYYFALKAKDETGNESVLSNVVSATTLTPSPSPSPTPAATSGFEIKVTPETLNLASQGNWVSVHLILPAPHKASDVNFSSLRLNGTLAPDGGFKGVDKFEKGKSDKGRGSSSLILKFSRAGVQRLASSASASLTLTLTGKVSDVSFSASDTISVLSKADIDNDGDDQDNEGELVQATSSPEVYIIKNGKKRHIPSPQALARLKLNWERIKKISEKILNAFSTDDLLRVEGDPRVYIIIAGMKRHLPTAEVFKSYGLSWEDITVVSKAELADYPDASLIRAAGDKKVYLLAGGKKHWIPTAEIFARKGFNWAAVIIVNVTEKDAIPTGENVN